jgi:hypothetical protein
MGTINEDEVSSHYSESSDSQIRTYNSAHSPSHVTTISQVDPTPDLPAITDMDHIIGDMCGSTTSLDMHTSRLKVTKVQCSRLAEERRVQLEEELRWRWWENNFYGAYQDIFIELLVVAIEVSDELQYALHDIDGHGASTGDEVISQTVQKLYAALVRTQANDIAAKQSWKETWKERQGPHFAAGTWI